MISGLFCIEFSAIQHSSFLKANFSFRNTLKIPEFMVYYAKGRVPILFSSSYAVIR